MFIENATLYVIMLPIVGLSMAYKPYFVGNFD